MIITTKQQDNYIFKKCTKRNLTAYQQAVCFERGREYYHNKNEKGDF